MSNSTLMALQELSCHSVRINYNLANVCRWKVGGNAKYFVEPATVSELQAMLRYANKTGLCHFVLGAGSNVLFSSEGFDGLIIRVGERFSSISVDEDVLRCQAGAWVPCVARYAANHSLSGLEHIVGIPGTIGGLVVMNGGTQRRGIGEYLLAVECIQPDGGSQTLSKEQCEFSYRHSIFQNTKKIVSEVSFKLPSSSKQNIRRMMLGILKERREKFPLKLPNCGSVFLSNPDMYSVVGPPGFVIENLGFKGYKVGNAKVSERHANFIVNCGGATHQDILTIVADIKKRVFEKHNFDMRCEVKFVTPQGQVMPLDEVSN